MSQLLIGLAGGAIGALLAGIGFVAVRLSAVPGEVARHDRRAVALNEDLERWVADDHRKLRQVLSGITNEYAARGLLYSGIHLGSRSEAKTQALQAYRDRCSESERALADLMADEGWPHERWRWLRGRRAHELEAAVRIEPVIDEWRAATTAAGMTDEAKIYDPTRWTTDDLLRDIRKRPLEAHTTPDVSANVRVEVREAWGGPSVGASWGDDPQVDEPRVFEATVVAINVGDQPVFVEVLGLEAANAFEGCDDRLDSNIREVPPGGNVSLVVAEDTTDFDMRSGVRGFAELATGVRIESELLVPVPLDHG